jgi:hypothetical protein
MSTREVAEGLVAKCRQGDFMGAIEQYYSKDIVSIEPVGNAAYPAELHGIDAIRQKNETWIENNEVHGIEVKGPFVGDDGFAVQYRFQFTNRPTGEERDFSEVAVYQVAGDKVVREQFFYHAG